MGILTIPEAGTSTHTGGSREGQLLGRGRTKVETFVVKSLDGTEHTVTITITGVNDGAVISGNDTGAVLELALIHILRCPRPLTRTDVDGADE
ncbi:VCBS domain-containing protein, partial [Aeromonas salmonicida]|uniref:VCBS domain-containing protein n=1 Tax=Aeromonas salmonicida TaxID=645 RepID=UPI003D3120AC